MGAMVVKNPQPLPALPQTLNPKTALKLKLQPEDRQALELSALSLWSRAPRTTLQNSSGFRGLGFRV